MKKYFKKIKDQVVGHKSWAVLFLIVIVGLIYLLFRSFGSNEGEVSYVTAKVKKETIVNTVSGTGQISALSQVDLKTKASGDITYLNLKVGQEVKTGAYLAQLDSGDVAYELESAQIAYDELITIDSDDLQRAKNEVEDSKNEMENAYVDARISVVKATTDLADNLADMSDLLDGYLISSQSGLSQTAKGYIQKAEEKYNLANKSLNSYLKNYRIVSVESDMETIESLLTDIRDTANLVLEGAKSIKDSVVYLRDREDDPSSADTAYATANELIISVDTIVSNLSSADITLTSSKRSLKDAEIALSDLLAGPDTLELRSQALALKQKQKALADYSVTAPFAGLIASVEDINIGDTVNSGTVIGTLITKQKIAEISLNEIDAAKVKAGQKASLTFDAFDDLIIVGTVAEINLIGTVSQGVVSYTVKISLDTQDERVKSGMSVSASITIEAKEDVLAVSSSAIKSQAETDYVEILESVDSSRPKRQEIVTGISNDTMTEIVSGLKEGDIIIIKTTTGTTAETKVRTPSVSNILSGNRMSR